jgi:hypothetical protein
VLLGGALLVSFDINIFLLSIFFYLASRKLINTWWVKWYIFTILIPIKKDLGTRSAYISYLLTPERRI